MWQQLQIKATAENAEIISDVLLGLGVEAITLLDAKDQPILEPAPGETPLWNEAWVSALLKESVEVQPLIEQLKLILSLQNIEYKVISFQDKNWTREWLEHFKPMRFGERLWVTPAEHIAEIDAANAVIIQLDPGLAFGTGTHPTTALCLEWLEKNIDATKAPTVIDFGCGSGILAIAAAKLGAGKIYAVDNDPQAITATKENLQRNGISEKQVCALHSDDFKPFEADILVANILSNPLIELAPAFFQLVKPQGSIALSGILVDQVEKLEHVYTQCFELNVPKVQEDWALISGQRKAK